jgi:hypothetical protein
MRKSKLRIVLLSLPLLCSVLTGAWAQLRKPYTLPVPPKDTSTFWIFKDVTAGPYFAAGISRQNENLPEASPSLRWHSLPRFAYTVGGIIDFSISKWFGIDFTGFYDSRDLYVGNSGDSDNIDVSLGYLTFQPSIRIFWLLIGLSFDIPLSGSATENLAAYQRSDQPTTHNYAENLNVQTSDIHSMTELRATLSLPILQGEDANVHVIISGSYPLSKTIAGTASYDTTGHTPTSGITAQYGRFSGPFTPGQGPLPTLEAGISYQFDLLH